MAAGTGSAFATSKSDVPAIKVLSNRADVVSGGDALVEIVPPRGTHPGRLKVTVGKRNVTSSFAVRPGGRYMALLGGLRNGRNVVTATAPNGGIARLTIVNHPIGGPVTAGKQIQPWRCAAGASDKQCNRRPRYEYSYKSTTGGELREYDPENPPSDVATTTTDQGRTVPFIVRQEVGAIDRDEYRIAVLYDPARPWAPWAPQPGYNHKLVVFHGASCDTHYQQDEAPDVLNETALGRGFATMSHALNNAGHNCSIATQAESMIMTKERVAEQLGPIRYTIGSGCSGGALAQQQVANAYPGFYQGITPACSFTDAWSSAMQYVDYVGARNYFEHPEKWQPGVVWTPDQIAAVEGHPNPVNAITFTEAIPFSGEPTRDCVGVPPEQVFDENTNPRGVRCTLQDYMVNIFGPRERSVWSPVEKQLGHGFAGRPFDNVGVEYGRKAFDAGRISVAQFVDLNAKAGGADINATFEAKRAEADRPALERVYRSGAVNQGTHLDKVAIIDLRGPDPGAFHDVYRTYVMRARLQREHGTTANQVLWRGQVPLLGDASYTDEAIVAMDSWLAAIEKDKRKVPLARKIIEDKPPALRDRCTNGAGAEAPASSCDATVQSYSSPRIEAGMPLTDDTIKCELQPLRRARYPGITEDGWRRLQRAFPTGVCDYGKPGVDRTPTVPWLSYKAGPGGKPLGAAPRSRGCVDRRKFSFRIHQPRRGRVVRVTVYINGKKRKVVRAKRGKRVRRVTIRRLPRKRFRVKIVARHSSGKRTISVRRYRGCKKSRPKTRVRRPGRGRGR
jgi:hypothetical protein